MAVPRWRSARPQIAADLKLEAKRLRQVGLYRRRERRARPPTKELGEQIWTKTPVLRILLHSVIGTLSHGSTPIKTLL